MHQQISSTYGIPRYRAIVQNTYIYCISSNNTSTRHIYKMTILLTLVLQIYGCDITDIVLDYIVTPPLSSSFLCFHIR